MPTAVLKLFAEQGTVADRLTDRRTKRRLYASLFGEHKKGLTLFLFLNNNYCLMYEDGFVM